MVARVIYSLTAEIAQNSSDGQEKHGAINCNASDASCLSFGELHLRSQYGDIEIVLGCDTFQCN